MDQRNEQEFADYFAARRDAVRRTAYLICGDWHHADDLAQSAFVALHRRWRKVRDKGALDAYVRRTLVRAAIDESRRPWRREHAVEVLPEIAMGAAGSSAVDDVVTTRSALVNGLQQVPARQRAVLVLRFLEGQSVAAVATAMKCTEGTVKSQTARGLDTLRAVLGDALDDLRPAG